MALPASFMDELRLRTPLAAVVGRRVRLARSGRQWKGCCPFHGEKTPSFYVYEDGHYHCFGCGAHGDAISFVMQSEGAGFMEAVERLATEAGLEVPKPSPEAAEAERRRHDLALRPGSRRRPATSADCSCRRAATRSTTSSAAASRRRRSAAFGLGWSGEGRGALAADLGRDGVTQDQLVDSGLMRRDDETGRVFDLFFNRVMFPIRDRRGRVISFGGRILGDGQPKYVNGPETALFSKRRTLYGLDLAREAVRGGAALLVVEGYMDVIALAQAGIRRRRRPARHGADRGTARGAVASRRQRPILCFDGDAAGSRAAARAAELALPLLAPDRSLQAGAPAGGRRSRHLVRRRGADGMQSVLDAATPLADALYDLLREAGGDTTPEQRAAFLTRLDQAARRIPDKALADEYREALRGTVLCSATPRIGGTQSQRANRAIGPLGAPPSDRRRALSQPSGTASSPPSCCAIPSCCATLNTPTPASSFPPRSQRCEMRFSHGRKRPKSLTPRP